MFEKSSIVFFPFLLLVLGALAFISFIHLICTLSGCDSSTSRHLPNDEDKRFGTASIFSRLLMLSASSMWPFFDLSFSTSADWFSDNEPNCDRKKTAYKHQTNRNNPLIFLSDCHSHKINILHLNSLAIFICVCDCCENGYKTWRSLAMAWFYYFSWPKLLHRYRTNRFKITSNYWYFCTSGNRPLFAASQQPCDCRRMT